MSAVIDGLMQAYEVLGEANDALSAYQATIEALQQSHHDAWQLIGRLDYFLETMGGQTPAARRRMAAKLRSEIKKAGGI